MRPPLYRAQLARDLDDWVEEGLVAPDKRAAILARVDREGRFGLSGLLGLLGALLIVAAVLSFIAANWQGLDKMPRLLILVGGLWGAVALAAWTKAKQFEAASEAALLVSVGIYGAAIWFVGQTYHLAGGIEDGLMLWALGTLAAALLAPSAVTMAAGYLLAMAWIVTAWAQGSDTALWLYPPVLVVTLAMTLRAGWAIALHVATLSVVTYMVASTVRLGDLLSLSEGPSFAGLALVALALWAGLNLVSARREWTVRPLRFWALIVAVLATLVVSWSDVLTNGDRWMPVGVSVLAAVAAMAFGAAGLRRLAVVDALVVTGLSTAIVTLPLLGEIPALVVMGAMLVWTVSLGLRRGDRLAVNLGFAGFGLWTVYLYVVVFDDFLQGAVFFAVGGVLLIAMALGLERVRRVMLARTEVPS